MGDCIEERGLADAVHLVHLGLVMVMVMVMVMVKFDPIAQHHDQDRAPTGAPRLRQQETISGQTGRACGLAQQAWWRTETWVIISKSNINTKDIMVVH